MPTKTSEVEAVTILARDIVASLQAFETCDLCPLPPSHSFSAVAAMDVVGLAGAFAILLVGRGCVAADDLAETLEERRLMEVVRAAGRGSRPRAVPFRLRVRCGAGRGGLGRGGLGRGLSQVAGVQGVVVERLRWDL